MSIATAIVRVKRTLDLRTRTDVIYRALCAIWIARITESATVPDQSDRVLSPIFFRIQILQIYFDLMWFGILTQAEPPGEPLDVCVYRPTWYTKCDTKHDVGGFSTNAGKLSKLLERGRNFTAELLYQCLRALLYVRRFSVEVARWFDQIFDILNIRLSKGFGGREFLEKTRRAFVDLNVRRLSRQDYRCK